MSPLAKPPSGDPANQNPQPGVLAKAKEGIVRGGLKGRLFCCLPHAMSPSGWAVAPAQVRIIESITEAEKWALCQQARQGDQRATSALYQCVEALAKRVAGRHRPRWRALGLDVEDLGQTAALGVARAIHVWNPERGKWTTCAGNYARYAILDAMTMARRQRRHHDKPVDDSVDVEDESYRGHPADWAEARISLASHLVAAEKNPEVFRTGRGDPVP